MLTKIQSYKIRTLFLGLSLCISFLFGQTTESNTTDSLVNEEYSSDIHLIQPIILEKVIGFHLISNKLWEKTKIPLYMKEGNKIAWLRPALAWNNYDKTQLGLAIGAQKPNKYQFLLTPMFGTGSKNLTGTLNSKVFFENSKLHLFTLGLDTKRFSYLLFPEDLAYTTLTPSLAVSPLTKLKGKLILKLRTSLVWQEYILNGRKNQFFYLNLVSVEYQILKSKFANTSQVSLLQGKFFTTLSLQNNFELRYNKRTDSHFYLKGFLGAFLYNTKPSSNIDAPNPIFQLSGTSNSGIYWLQKDFAFNDFYLDRNAQDNFLQKQIASSEGGFNSLTNLGNANSFLFSVNLKSDIMLPFKVKRIINLQPFLNIAYSKNRNVSGAFYGEGGASVLLFNEILGFHIPFATTKNIQENQSSIYGIDKGDWPKRITFSLDIMKILEKI